MTGACKVVEERPESPLAHRHDLFSSSYDGLGRYATGTSVWNKGAIRDGTHDCRTTCNTALGRCCCRALFVDGCQAQLARHRYRCEDSWEVGSDGGELPRGFQRRSTSVKDRPWDREHAS
jgi:hypothetical protein